jgi:hypothetical protein
MISEHYNDTGTRNDQRCSSSRVCGGRERDANMKGFSQRLELRQSQRLIITPQMRRSIEMLQLSNLEITDFIAAEMEQNPLLEWCEQPLGENEPGDYDNGEGRMPATTMPEMLTGDVASDVAEGWQPEWGENSDRTVDIGGEPQPWKSRNGGINGENRLGLD